VSEDDVKLVMTQAECSREKAIEALEHHRGDILGAIVYLTRGIEYQPPILKQDLPPLKRTFMSFKEVSDFLSLPERSEPQFIIIDNDVKIMNKKEFEESYNEVSGLFCYELSRKVDQNTYELNQICRD
jgi:hypothetical protein